jgi:hypothetical protein
MHGEELIFDNLSTTTISHTFISEIGKLGLPDLVDKNTNHDTFCEKIKEIKKIYKGKSIKEGNDSFKINCDQTYYNKFKNDEEKQELVKLNLSEEQEYKNSSCLVRVLSHDKEYSLVLASDEIEQKIHTDGEYNINLLNSQIETTNKQLIYDELYNCGIYIIETYGLPIEQKTRVEQLDTPLLPSCLNSNLLFLNNIYALVEILGDEQKSKDIMNLIEKLGIINFKNRMADNGRNFTFDKINSIKLSCIIDLFNILGFNHVNIIEKSCRWVDDEFLYKDNKDIRPNTFLRQKSFNEKKIGKDVNDTLVGGKIKKTKKQKNKKNKNKKTKKV